MNNKTIKLIKKYCNITNRKESEYRILYRSCNSAERGILSAFMRRWAQVDKGSFSANDFNDEEAKLYEAVGSQRNRVMTLYQRENING